MIGSISDDKFSTQQYNNTNNKTNSGGNNSASSTSTTVSDSDSYSASAASKTLDTSPPQNGVPLTSPEAAHALVQQLTASIAANIEQAGAAFSQISSGTVEASLG